MKTKQLLFSVMALIICTAVNSQTNQNLDEKYGKDVKSISAIIDTYYDVISGASTDPWQFERDSYLHSQNAHITRLDENGTADTHTLESEYIPILLMPKEDFYEIELKRIVSEFGNMAQVWSAYEVRTNPKIISNIRGLNSIQLHYENGRWFIDRWTTQMQTEANSIVEEFLKTK